MSQTWKTDPKSLGRHVLCDGKKAAKMGVYSLRFSISSVDLAILGKCFKFDSYFNGNEGRWPNTFNGYWKIYHVITHIHIYIWKYVHYLKKMTVLGE